MDNFEYCGTIPRKWWLLGQMAAVQSFLEDAASLMRLNGAQQPVNPAATQYKLLAAYDIVARLASKSSHCDLTEALETASGSLADLSVRVMDATVPATDLHGELLLLIRIVIKIGKLIITIEF